MATHDVNATAIGTVALFQALCRHLTKKGLMNDDEFTAVANDALANASTNPNAAEIIAFIRDAVGAPPA